MFNRQFKPIKVSKKLIVGFILLGLGILLFANWDVYKRWLNLESKGIIVNGIITDCQPVIINKSQKSSCCHYVFEVKKQNLSYRKCDCNYNVGDLITIRYNPLNPNENEILR